MAVYVLVMALVAGLLLAVGQALDDQPEAAPERTVTAAGLTPAQLATLTADRLEADHLRASRSAPRATTTTQPPPPPTTTTTTTRRDVPRETASPPTTRRRTVATSPPPTSARAPAAPPAGPGRSVSSTAYCLTGTMASGRRTYRRAVAANAWPLGTVLEVSAGPYGPGRYTVADRIGHGSQLDFAMPGDCAGARAWGRRSVSVHVAT